VGGIPEMVENNESALLVPASNPEALAAAIQRVLIEKEFAQRLTANAYALVTTRFTPEKYVRSVAEIYREVINARQISRTSN
jgi:glycosyltransferase involved in cell wall biosynthesis